MPRSHGTVPSRTLSRKNSAGTLTPTAKYQSQLLIQPPGSCQLGLNDLIPANNSCFPWQCGLLSQTYQHLDDQECWWVVSEAGVWTGGASCTESWFLGRIPGAWKSMDLKSNRIKSFKETAWNNHIQPPESKKTKVLLRPSLFWLHVSTFRSAPWTLDNLPKDCFHHTTQASKDSKATRDVGVPKDSPCRCNMTLSSRKQKPVETAPQRIVLLRLDPWRQFLPLSQWSSSSSVCFSDWILCKTAFFVPPKRLRRSTRLATPAGKKERQI